MGKMADTLSIKSNPVVKTEAPAISVPGSNHRGAFIICTAGGEKVLSHRWTYLAVGPEIREEAVSFSQCYPEKKELKKRKRKHSGRERRKDECKAQQCNAEFTVVPGEACKKCVPVAVCHIDCVCVCVCLLFVCVCTCECVCACEHVCALVSMCVRVCLYVCFSA